MTGPEFRALYESVGWTREQVAAMLEVSWRTIWRRERDGPTRVEEIALKCLVTAERIQRKREEG